MSRHLPPDSFSDLPATVNWRHLGPIGSMMTLPVVPSAVRHCPGGVWLGSTGSVAVSGLRQHVARNKQCEVTVGRGSASAAVRARLCAQTISSGGVAVRGQQWEPQWGAAVRARHCAQNMCQHAEKCRDGPALDPKARRGAGERHDTVAIAEASAPGVAAGVDARAVQGVEVFGAHVGGVPHVGGGLAAERFIHELPRLTGGAAGAGVELDRGILCVRPADDGADRDAKCGGARMHHGSVSGVRARLGVSNLGLTRAPDPRGRSLAVGRPAAAAAAEQADGWVRSSTIRILVVQPTP